MNHASRLSPGVFPENAPTVFDNPPATGTGGPKSSLPIYAHCTVAWSTLTPTPIVLDIATIFM